MKNIKIYYDDKVMFAQVLEVTDESVRACAKNLIGEGFDPDKLGYRIILDNKEADDILEIIYNTRKAAGDNVIDLLLDGAQADEDNRDGTIHTDDWACFDLECVSSIHNTHPCELTFTDEDGEMHTIEFIKYIPINYGK